MNNFKRWFIGDYLEKTTDVFERSKIELLFHYSVSFWVLGTVFYVSAIVRGYTLHAYVLTFAVIALLLIPFILKFKENVRLASVWYIVQQIIVSTGESMIQKNKPELATGLWIMTFILFSFFLFGRKWGLIIILLSSLIQSISVPIAESLPIPESEQYQGSIIEIMVPLLLNIIIVWMFIKTRSDAEQHIKNQSVELETKRKELEAKNKDVRDSINYAKRIQYAVLPQEETIYRSIPLSFIFYKPKDIVSGDFFWFHEINRDEYILVCADCTGHGVPGAFMTVIGSSLLNQTVIDKKIFEPSKILTELDYQINFTLKQQKDTTISVQDGMDLTLLKVNKDKKELIVTSAKRSVVFIRNKVVQEIKGSKFSLGGMRSGDKKFEEIRINYQEDDLLYMFTDGYPDQFGGEKAKKFSTKRLRELFGEICQQPMQYQKERLANVIQEWQGNLEQIDDMLVIGVKL